MASSRTLLLTGLTGLSALFCGSPAAVAQTFTFDTTPVGTTSPFSATSGGVMATFASPEMRDAFVVTPSFFRTLTGNTLLSLADNPAVSLGIAFSAPLAGISVVFATNGPGAFTLDAFQGSTLVGSVTTSGTLPGGAFEFAEGTLTFGGAQFQTVRLRSTALDFAIDDVAVTVAGSPSVAPEPNTKVLLGLGLVVVAGPIFRRRRAAPS